MTDSVMVARWLAAYRDQQTFRAIAARFGVDESTVRRHVLAEVAPRRTGPPQRPISVDQVVELHRDGLSQRQIAAELRCSGQLVRSRLAAAGLAPPADRRPRKRR